MRLFSYVKVFGNITKYELKEYYKLNKITVNDIVMPLSYIIRDDDIIKVDNVVIEPKELVYYLYYKPVGVLSDIKDSSDSYINFIPSELKLMPCGRLDKNSEGLMILTNDGSFINKICSPSTHEEKEYIVTLKNIITDEFMENIVKPQVLDNKLTKPIKAIKIDNLTVKMILTEGIYRQIRRIVKINNNEVINLKRIRIGNFYINNMKPGDIIRINKI